MSGRNPAIDCLKLFAIFLVVWGHCIQYFNPEVYITESAYRIIYAFHMPLFMMISGLFASKSLQTDIKTLIIKKSKNILLPCFFWITLSWFVVACIEGNFSFGKLLWGYKDQFWFLKSVFICYLLAYVANKGVWMQIIILIISQFIPYSGVSFMYLCFFVGQLLSRDGLENGFLVKYRIIIYLIFIVLLFFYDERLWSSDFLAGGHILSGNLRMLGLYLYRISVGLLGAISFIYLFGVDLKFVKLSGTLSHAGQLTLGIYLMQSIVLERFLGRVLIINESGFLFVYILYPLISLAIIVLCIFIMKCFHGRSFWSQLLFGVKM